MSIRVLFGPETAMLFLQDFHEYHCYREEKGARFCVSFEERETASGTGEKQY